MRRRVRGVLTDWRQHKRPFEDTDYWIRRFAPFEDVFAHTRGSRPLELWRNERTDINNRYTDRFTSWSSRDQDVEGFGWGQRRMVTAWFKPSDILVDFHNLGHDPEAMREVIVWPGNYDIIPWRLVHDRRGFFNAYEDPARAGAAGYELE
jgi:hypothetical protein